MHRESGILFVCPSVFPSVWLEKFERFMIQNWENGLSLVFPWYFFTFCKNGKYGFPDHFYYFLWKLCSMVVYGKFCSVVFIWSSTQMLKGCETRLRTTFNMFNSSSGKVHRTFASQLFVHRICSIPFIGTSDSSKLTFPLKGPVFLQS